MIFSKFGRRAVFASFVSIGLLSAACGGASDASTTDSTSEDLSSKPGHFETFAGKDGQHYFDLVAGNGQIVLASQGYASDEGARRGIIVIIDVGVDSTSYKIAEAKNGEWYFDVRAANGETVAVSETYASKSNATRGANAVRAVVNHLGARPTITPVTR